MALNLIFFHYIKRGSSTVLAKVCSDFFFFKREMIQGLISEPNFLLAGVSHHHAEFQIRRGTLPMFACTYSFYRILFPGALRAAHPSATYANTNRKEAQTLSLPLSSAPVRPWSHWKPRAGSSANAAAASVRGGAFRGGCCPQGTAGIKNKRGSGTSSQATWVQMSTCPLPSACL